MRAPLPNAAACLIASISSHVAVAMSRQQVSPSMTGTGRRFRPSLWPTLGMLAFVALTIGLGNWQRHRAAEKDALRAQLDASASQAPLDLAILPQDAASARFRRLRVDGTFDASHQVLIDNKVHA